MTTNSRVRAADRGPEAAVGAPTLLSGELDRLYRERDVAEQTKLQLQRELKRSTTDLRERERRYQEAARSSEAKQTELTALRESLDRLDRRLQGTLYDTVSTEEDHAVRHVAVEALRRAYDTALESIEVLKCELARASTEASLLRLQMSTVQNQVDYLYHESYRVGNLLTRLMMNIAALEKRRAEREGGLFLL